MDNEVIQRILQFAVDNCKVKSPCLVPIHNVPELLRDIEWEILDGHLNLPDGTEDRIFPDITEKKSLGSFIAKTATRAGIVLWEKPFQNMRSSRATELIAIYPAHVVNAIMGHTEAVAMAHYRQVLDSDFEKLSAPVTDKKRVQIRCMNTLF